MPTRNTPSTRQRILHGTKWVLGIALVLVILGYSGFEAKRVVEGPSITLLSPLEHAVMNTSLIRISGTVRNAASLTLNGRLIAIDTTGRFDEQLLLSYGYNIMELVAIDRAGNSVKKPIAVFYQ